MQPAVMHAKQCLWQGETSPSLGIFKVFQSLLYHFLLSLGVLSISTTIMGKFLYLHSVCLLVRYICDTSKRPIEAAEHGRGQGFWGISGAL